MSAAQAGDQKSYRQLLNELIPFVRSIVRRRISDPVLVEDVIQDILLTMHRVRHTYDPSRPFGPWISVIASARSIDAQRRSGRLSRREVDDGLALESEVGHTAAVQFENLAVVSELHHLLGRLPERERRVVELVKLREMTLEEAAFASSLSVPAIKALLHRAFAKLRKHGNQDYAGS